MAYETKHLRQVVDLGGVVGGAIWCLDGIDAVASVDTAAFISDAFQKGMQKGDLVLYRRWTTTVPAAKSEVCSAAGSANILLGMHLFPVIGITLAANGMTGSADLTDGTALSVTNTD